MEQMENTRKLIETLGQNNVNLRKSNEKLQEETKDVLQSQVKLDKMMIEQLKQENEWLKSVNENNIKDKERTEKVEKALYQQFNELKDQIELLKK